MLKELMEIWQSSAPPIVKVLIFAFAVYLCVGMLSIVFVISFLQTPKSQETSEPPDIQPLSRSEHPPSKENETDTAHVPRKSSSFAPPSCTESNKTVTETTTETTTKTTALTAFDSLGRKLTLVKTKSKSKTKISAITKADQAEPPK